MVKWNVIIKRLMSLMDQRDGSYFSGGRFIRAIQEFNPDLSDYARYIAERNAEGKSTTRRDYFRDILMDLEWIWTKVRGCRR